MEELRSEDPRRVGEFRLLGRLGAGGMGLVYLARSARGRTAAVKLVHAELAAREEFRRRFRQEVAAARRVGGEWTAPVLDADTEAATPWVATGYVAGPTLQDVVTGRTDGRGPLPDRSVLLLAGGLARALSDIHRAGLVHRDLKPSNILVTVDGPRVIDFGIARALQSAEGAALATRTGAVIGSPGFMSPEQVRGERVTTASDVFCLGAVLAFAATGRVPFGDTENGIHALMFRIAQEEPDLSGVRPGPLRELIADCLAKEPGRRPTVPELLDRTRPGDGADAEDTAWLPGELTAHLARLAVRLLDTETPAAPGPDQDARPAPAAPAPQPGFGPVLPEPPGRFGPVSPPPHPRPPYPLFPGQPYQTAATARPHPRAGRPGAGPGRALSPRGLSTAVVIALCTYMLVSVFYVHHEFGTLLELNDMIARGGSGQEFQDWKQGDQDVPLETILLTFLTFPVAVVVWLAWFRRVRINAGVFAPGTQRLGRGWAIGAWFIPVGHLWIPKQISNDIWAASIPPHARAGGPRGVLHAWWLLWTTQTAPIYFSLAWRTLEETGSAAEARIVTAVDLTGEVLTLAAAVFAILMVQRLTEMQERRIEALPEAAPPPHPYAVPLHGGVPVR
ncbi:DUF4328 domain-containing protein [Streptomyces sp. NPDC018031]|uniref:protein kinase domain-containing protein n=1 Tax=Streptomyces sp. NPDC018031 TaxID=3365033 RepID=UPI003788CD91